MNATRSLLAAAALASAMLGGASALAQAVQPAAPRAAQATQTAAPALNIREIELEKYGHYEVKARNAQGDRVKLHVNAQTGEIERNRFDD